MIHLSQFLQEARQMVGKLPFSLEEFSKFIVAAGDYDDESDDYIKIEQIVTQVYGEKIWRSLKGWIEAQAYQADPEKLYNALQKFPVDRLEKLLGAGSYGAALTVGNNRVIKWLHPYQVFEENDLSFYTYCSEVVSSHFPKIYKLGSNYVVMEKLAMHTKKCEQYIRSSNKQIPTGKRKWPLWYCAEHMVLGTKDADPKVILHELQKLNKEDKEYWDWHTSLLREAKGAGFEPADLNINNIGERKTGEIIWFDI